MVLLDTYVLIVGLDAVTEPAAVSVVSMIELTAGLNAAADPTQRALRQERYDALRARFEPLPVDERVLLRYGRIDAGVRASGRTPRKRLADLMIAATASAYELDLVTHSVDDFRGLEHLVRVRRP